MKYEIPPGPKYWLDRGLPMRVAYALANGGIYNEVQLRRCSERDLRRLPNFGIKSWRVVCGFLGVLSPEQRVAEVLTPWLRDGVDVASIARRAVRAALK